MCVFWQKMTLLKHPKSMKIFKLPEWCKSTVMWSGGLKMDGFCLVEEFHWGGSATNRATPSSYIYIYFFDTAWKIPKGHSTCAVSSTNIKIATKRADQKKALFTCHLSLVMCQMSCVTCHLTTTLWSCTCYEFEISWIIAHSHVGRTPKTIAREGDKQSHRHTHGHRYL